MKDVAASAAVAALTTTGYLLLRRRKLGILGEAGLLWGFAVCAVVFTLLTLWHLARVLA